MSGQVPKEPISGTTFSDSKLSRFTTIACFVRFRDRSEKKFPPPKHFFFFFQNLILLKVGQKFQPGYEVAAREAYLSSSF